MLASLSGIFRDLFANIVDLLDDMFERAAVTDGGGAKSSSSLRQDGVERPAARLFSNPPGEYGSMVNEEVVGSGDWEQGESLGETWKGRNVFSYGRNEGKAGITAGTVRVFDLYFKLHVGFESIIYRMLLVLALNAVCMSYLFLPAHTLTHRSSCLG